MALVSSSTMNPARPSSTTSGTEPRLNAITGVPQAMASIMTRPNGSGQSMGTKRAMAPLRKSDFSWSVMENIRYGRPDAADEEVLDAVFAARCDFIEDLPDGMRTLVGERGVRLSGGQRQRIAIARAFLKNAPLLLLDEATSALDGESEEAIREALGRLMRGRTVIAIAHRLSTVRSFDRIVVLQLGKVVQEGPPDLLIRRDGPYRRLVQREMDRLATRAAA
jgi:ATP-binding cassette, subfamily B, bacterial